MQVNVLNYVTRTYEHFIITCACILKYIRRLIFCFNNFFLTAAHPVHNVNLYQAMQKKFTSTKKWVNESKLQIINVVILQLHK